MFNRLKLNCIDSGERGDQKDLITSVKKSERIMEWARADKATKKKKTPQKKEKGFSLETYK